MSLLIEKSHSKRHHLRRKKLRQKSQRKDIARIGFAFICTSMLLFTIPLGNTYFRLPKVTALNKPDLKISAVNGVSVQPEGKILLAQAGKIKIYLPFPAEELTLVAFHQAMKDDVKELSPMGRERKKVLPSRAYNEVRSHFSTSDPMVYIKLLRPGRPGNSNRAIDIGASAGTKVYAPVSGKVIKAEDYSLYGKYKDSMLTICPDAWPEVEVTIYHLQGVVVKPGQRLIEGQNEIGKIRDVSVYFKSQLSDYTNDAGNHVHIQVNEPRPDEPETGPQQ